MKNLRKSFLDSSNLKEFFLFALFMAAVPFAAFAQQPLIPAPMYSLAERIRDVFTSTFVRMILVIILSATAVTYAFNKDNEKMKRNCIAIIVGAAIIMSATFIVDLVFR